MEDARYGTQLTQADKKHWAPTEPVVQWLADRLPPDAKVLEIGPGHVPFPRASVFVDYKSGLPIPPGAQLVQVDMAKEKLPFADKEFDFVYCRHVIEDMYNPFLLLSEMERVAKAGYIETPSPIAEMCRGVDGASPPFRGYHHHHYVVWVHEGQLRLVSKYPIVEYFRFAEEDVVGWLREGPRAWNTHYLWQDKINFLHLQTDRDFDITRDYAALLKSAMDQSKISSEMFWLDVPAKLEISQRGLSRVA